MLFRSFVFDCICQGLGKKYFSSFSNCLASILNNRIKIANNTIFWGRQDIEIVLKDPDKTTRSVQLLHLQQAFVEDLKAIPDKMVLLIDSFELAPSEVKNWISGTFLQAAAQIPKLLIVVAGQEVPDHNNIAWGDYCHFVELGLIKDHRAWCQFAQDAQLSFSDQEALIRGLTIGCEGQPEQIRNLFNKIAKEWQQC